MITESIRSWAKPVYAPVRKGAEGYRTVKKYRAILLEDLKRRYFEIDDSVESNVPLLQRIIRDDMELFIRNYHKYNIEQRLIQPGNKKGAHYIEVGATSTDFEHLVPLNIMRDMYLFDEISIDEILNPPTVLLSKEKHQMLKDTGWDRDTPDKWLPFLRYSNIIKDIKIETIDGTEVDPATWTLARHYEYFDYLNNR